MDPKKQDLSPELKEVYDRVMNTTAKPTQTPPPAGGPNPSTPTPAAPAATVQVETQTSAPANEPNQSSAPTMVTTTVQTPATSPTSQPAAAGNMPAGTAPAAAPTAFVFNGNKMTSDGKTTAAGKKKTPGFLIPLGVVILVIAWAAIWAKFFGIF